LSAVRARVPLAVDAEVTLEANPGTFEAERFAGYRRAGINRLSIGIQSFNPSHLKVLGRIHDEAQAVRAVEIAREQFANFNLDLMYALPQQTLAEACADVERALSYAPPHLSIYHLTIEPNTYFHSHPPVVPDNDAAAEMQDGIESLMASAGYEHYETSAYARPRRQSRHNLNYWTFGDYVGIGAGAHSKISFPSRILRQARYRQPREYMARALEGKPVQVENDVPASEIPVEFMMNAFRLTEGFPLALFEERSGMPLVSVLKALDEAERRGFVVRDHQYARPTELGRRFLNDLLQIFMSS
jgi:putative oxygen-independent coproporphyrinogen III oxidase